VCSFQGGAAGRGLPPGSGGGAGLCAFSGDWAQLGRTHAYVLLEMFLWVRKVFLHPDLVELFVVSIHVGTWFSGHGGDGVTVGLDDLRGLFQPE